MEAANQESDWERFAMLIHQAGERRLSIPEAPEHVAVDLRIGFEMWALGRKKLYAHPEYVRTAESGDHYLGLWPSEEAPALVYSFRFTPETDGSPAAMRLQAVSPDGQECWIETQLATRERKGGFNRNLCGFMEIVEQGETLEEKIQFGFLDPVSDAVPIRIQ